MGLNVLRSLKSLLQPPSPTTWTSRVLERATLRRPEEGIVGSVGLPVSCPIWVPDSDQTQNLWNSGHVKTQEAEERIPVVFEASLVYLTSSRPAGTIE